MVRYSGRHGPLACPGLIFRMDPSSPFATSGVEGHSFELRPAWRMELFDSASCGASGRFSC